MSIEIEGPYSSTEVDGLVTPVYIYLPGGIKQMVGKATVKVENGMTFAVSLTEEYKDIDMASFEVPMRYAYLKDPKPVINWGYNCLTEGVHHGRPEALWNLPLLQVAMAMIQIKDLQELVVARIYADALQMVEQGDEPRPSQEWAERVKTLAEEKFFDVLKAKMLELQNYYDSPQWRREFDGVIKLVKEKKLNSYYQPLHNHDTINMLCRIIGTKCSIEASKDG